ncbi:uncharacterized protein LOC133190714 [Saccostrea echinata]|uniref:uncharacterized protein LOC133190714 n=1 Tax=Saccostrea echinata TaxID=191078 RepID=UPI002A8227E2|nr:uncharacterized protein LOC133190714 [Saccostrea echinata]
MVSKKSVDDTNDEDYYSISKQSEFNSAEDFCEVGGLNIVRIRSNGLTELEPASTIKHDSQCYGTVPPNTTELHCSTNNSLVLRNLYIGTKKKSRCLQIVRDFSVSTNMTYHNDCCTYNENEDCVLSSENMFYKEMRRKIGIAASGKQNAVVNVKQFPMSGCPEGYLKISTYNSVEYYCIPDSRIFICHQSFARNNTNGETMYLQSPLYPNTTTAKKAYTCLIRTNCGQTITVYGVDYVFSSHTLQFTDTVSGKTLTLSNGSNDYNINPLFKSDFHKIVINFHRSGGNGFGRFRIAFKASGQNVIRLVCPFRGTPEDCNITNTSPTTFQSEPTTFQTESSQAMHPTYERATSVTTSIYTSNVTNSIKSTQTTTATANDSNQPIAGTITFTCIIGIGIFLVRSFFVLT